MERNKQRSKRHEESSSEQRGAGGRARSEPARAPATVPAPVVDAAASASRPDAADPLISRRSAVAASTSRRVIVAAAAASASRRAILVRRRCIRLQSCRVNDGSIIVQWTPASTVSAGITRHNPASRATRTQQPQPTQRGMARQTQRESAPSLFPLGGVRGASNLQASGAEPAACRRARADGKTRLAVCVCVAGGSQWVGPKRERAEERGDEGRPLDRRRIRAGWEWRGSCGTPGHSAVREAFVSVRRRVALCPCLSLLRRRRAQLRPRRRSSPVVCGVRRLHRTRAGMTMRRSGLGIARTLFAIVRAMHKIASGPSHAAGTEAPLREHPRAWRADKQQSGDRARGADRQARTRRKPMPNQGRPMQPQARRNSGAASERAGPDSLTD